MERPTGENKEIKELLHRYTAGKCTEEEKTWIESWYVRNDHGRIPGPSAGEMKQDLRRVLEQLPRKEHLRATRRARFRIAAVFALVAAAAGLYGYLSVGPSRQPAVEQAEGGDINPGGNKATLTLADGRKVVLDTVSNGMVARQSGIQITKTKGGQIVYAFHPEKKAVPSRTYNILRTPRGGQYRLTLSDGTRVWLNAASSIRYPASFGSAGRKVVLTGEAYFEVAETGTPFLVETRGQTVEVLGTQFNVNAYGDEPNVRTTLLEGSVRVTAATGLSTGQRGSQQVLLSGPGDQSVLEGRGFIRRHANPAVAIAWKEGLFRFEHTGIREVMRQISRWYDVEVEFRGEAPDIQLWGEVYRNAGASQVLEILTYFDLDYEILWEGNKRKIVIYPQ